MFLENRIELQDFKKMNSVEFCYSRRFVFVPGPEDPGFGSILPR